jgi:hypothetical protein
MKSKIEEIEIEEIEVRRSRSLKKSKFEEVEDLKFGDSTRVCNSSRVSGAADMGMPFRYPRISIPSPAH